jgi:hypothetical protein
MGMEAPFCVWRLGQKPSLGHAWEMQPQKTLEIRVPQLDWKILTVFRGLANASWLLKWSICKSNFPVSACNTNIQRSQAKKNYKETEMRQKTVRNHARSWNQFASENLCGASRGGVNKPYKMTLCSSNRNPRSIFLHMVQNRQEKWRMFLKRLLWLAKFGEIFLWIIATLATAQTWQKEHYVLRWWGSTNFGTMRARNWRRFFFPELNKFSPKYSFHDSFMSSKPCSGVVVLKAMIF